MKILHNLGLCQEIPLDFIVCGEVYYTSLRMEQTRRKRRDNTMFK